MSTSEINRRAGFRGYVTRTIKTIESLLNDPDAQANTLEVQAKVLINLREKIETLDALIQSELTENSTLQKDMEESFSAMVKIEKFVLLVEKKLSTFRNQATNSSVTPGIVKLPPLRLPFFSGCPLEWPHFWDTFKSSVHARPDISGAQKFTYLVGQLKDEPLKLLDGFTMTDLHYQEAIKLIQETYDKSEGVP